MTAAVIAKNDPAKDCQSLSQEAKPETDSIAAPKQNATAARAIALMVLIPVP
ncbi:hypothetical protein EL18_01532 [Nitratireductor basaltis]|uniref:Uncharacterized protein n=1 Tax=Nitratireductor basaltis TaxID=472175 RepID=A0A084UC11_9HYPH|nr:hypothetical protein EL18_01532 [Nitratireductor basaltis]